MTPKIEIFCQNFTNFGRFDGSFLTIFVGKKKSRFLDFFKVVLDLFRRCLGFGFGLKGKLVDVF